MTRDKPPDTPWDQPPPWGLERSGAPGSGRAGSGNHIRHSHSQARRCLAANAHTCPASAPRGERAGCRRMPRSNCRIQTPDPNAGSKRRIQTPDPNPGSKRRIQTPDPNAGSKRRIQTPDPNAGCKRRMQTPDANAGSNRRMQTPDPNAGCKRRIQTPDSSPCHAAGSCGMVVQWWPGELGRVRGASGQLGYTVAYGEPGNASGHMRQCSEAPCLSRSARTRPRAVSSTASTAHTRTHPLAGGGGNGPARHGRHGLQPHVRDARACERLLRCRYGCLRGGNDLSPRTDLVGVVRTRPG
jgi:hypothetical protein